MALRNSLIMLLVVWLLSFGCHLTANNGLETEVAGVVVSKYTAVSGGSTRYRVVVRQSGPSSGGEETETFELRDAFFGGFRTADEWAKLREGEAVRGKAYGWRWGFISQFRRLRPTQ